MNPTELYKLWAPEGALWSNWVKPVLFTQTPLAVSAYEQTQWRSLNVAWAPSVDSRSAVILDLPEDEAVCWGLALASRGFRPVPLYNGTPGISAVVNVGRIVGALHDLAQDLVEMPLTTDSPPVFLLDANRLGGGTVVSPGRFDNRWSVFPQDFPSATFLLAHGLRSVVLGQRHAGAPQRDLAHVLLRWQEAGLQILACDVQDNQPPATLQVTRPGNFRALWYRALVVAGLRRNSAGGFGAVVPEPSQSSGYG